MQELAEPPLLPQSGHSTGFTLESIKPLLAHLDALQENSKERRLTWEEDERAIGILKALVPKDEFPQLAKCVANFCHPRHRTERTLCGWYLYSRHVAEHLQDGE
jgi:hypothetical protein